MLNHDIFTNSHNGIPVIIKNDMPLALLVTVNYVVFVIKYNNDYIKEMEITFRVRVIE